MYELKILGIVALIGASAAQGYPPNGAKDYYLKHRDRIILHPVARSLLKKELVIK